MSISHFGAPVRVESEHRNGHDSAVYMTPSVNPLRANRLLRSLVDDELSQLLSEGQWSVYRQDEVISRQGKPVDTVLFLLEGRAKAEVAAPTGGSAKAAVNFLGPGDDIGLLSLVDGAPHSANVTALETIRALSVPFTAIRNCLYKHPEWYRILAEIAVMRLRTSGVWLQALL